MRRALVRAGLVLLCAVAGACGETPGSGSDPAGKPVAAVPAADLPRIGSVGDFPSPDRSVTVAATADGRIVTRDGPTDLAGLEKHLAAAAAKAPRVSAGGSSRLYAVLRVHRMAPWAVACWMLQACVAPSVRIGRPAFAVRAEEDDSEGALVYQFPEDVPLRPDESVEPDLKVRVVTGSEALDHGALYADAAWHFKRHPNCSGAVIEVPPRAPVGSVLTVVDLLRRAGAKHVLFGGVAPPKRDPETPESQTAVQVWVAQNPPLDGKWFLGVGSFSVGRDGRASAPPPAIRSRGALASLPPSHVAEDTWSAAPEEAVWEVVAHHGPEDVECVPAARPGAELPDRFLWRRSARGCAVERALDWLAAHQRRDGSWGSEDGGKSGNDVAVTALATLALVAGGARAAAAKVALDHLVSLQVEDGCVGPPADPLGHAIATECLVFAVVRGDEARKAAAQRALDLLAKRLDDIVARKKSAPSDAAVEAWAAFAVATARLANRNPTAEAAPSFAVPERALDVLQGRLDGLAARAPEAPDLAAGTPSTRLALGAAGAFAKPFVTGEPADAPKEGSVPTFPAWSSGADADLAGAFFGGLVASQAGGDAGRDFRAAALAALLARQRRDGPTTAMGGSFDPRDPWGKAGGRVYSTSMAALALLAADLFPPRFPAR